MLKLHCPPQSPPICRELPVVSSVPSPPNSTARSAFFCTILPPTRFFQRRHPPPPRVFSPPSCFVVPSPSLPPPCLPVPRDPYGVFGPFFFFFASCRPSDFSPPGNLGFRTNRLEFCLHVPPLSHLVTWSPSPENFVPPLIGCFLDRRAFPFGFHGCPWI